MSGGEVTTRSVVTELNAKRCSATGRDEKRPCCRRRRWLVAEESQVASCKSQVTSDLCEIERWMCDDGAVAVVGVSSDGCRAPKKQRQSSQGSMLPSNVPVDTMRGWIAV